MRLKKQIEALFQPLIGQKAWGASIGVGSFVTVEFGRKHLNHHHYHGDWHLWLYQCDWSLNSNGRCLANSESKKRVMQLAIDNLNRAELTDFSFDSQRTITEFHFDNHLELRCEPYPDATADEEYWMLFTPDRQVASLRESGLKYEPMDGVTATPSAGRKKQEIEIQDLRKTRQITLQD
ncbi:MAG: hypothetical protein ACLPLR_14590 [Terriglobales bacterium]